MNVGVWIGFAAALAVGSAVGATRLHFAEKPAAKQRQTARVLDAPTAAPTVDEAALASTTTPSELGSIELTTNRSRAWLLAEGPAKDEAASGKRWVTLTFDDGPFPDTTPAVLRLLARHHVRATFFFIGAYLDGDSRRAIGTRKAARDIDAAGHLVGSHTHDHALLTTITHTRVLDQIDDGISSIERATGHRPTLFRPPYGQVDPFTEEALAERHLGMILWSVETDDMEQGAADEDAMFQHLIEQLDFSAGGLVLLHDVKWPTVHVLARLLDWLDAKRWDANHPEKQGYSIVDLPTYFRETRARPQPFKTRKDLEESRATAWRASHPHSAS